MATPATPPDAVPSQRHALLVEHIRPQGLLSFGSECDGINLRPLNVLIGPNGSGKSNLIEIVALMRACVTDLREVVRRGGGADEWMWKGGAEKQGSIEWAMRFREPPPALDPGDFSGGAIHWLGLSSNSNQLVGSGEKIWGIDDNERGELFATYDGDRDWGRPYGSLSQEGAQDIVIETSDGFSFLTHSMSGRSETIRSIREFYKNIRIYRDWTFGRGSILRQPIRTDERADFLAEDFSNLALILSRLRQHPPTKRTLIEALRKLYEAVTDFEVVVAGGFVQVFITEGDYSIPAVRLSDGTLRYLCLLVILCDPEPPPLICLEEPELGLHPDIIPTIADLLVAASERTQLIITTHSDLLIDCLSETPEAVIVAEKDGNQTTLTRLNAEELSEWLKQYRLGQLWIDGHLGGKRW